MSFKPMLAGTPKNDADIRFPVLASPKIDGVRATVGLNADKQIALLSRSLKHIPNKHIFNLLSHKSLYGLDGELIVGSPTDPNAMQNTTSGVMTMHGMPDFTYFVFDKWCGEYSSAGFEYRFAGAARTVEDTYENWDKIFAFQSFSVCPIVLVQHKLIHNIDELDAYESEMLKQGWEGVMVRDPEGKYKYGRSTIKEGGLLKIKRFTDGEAEIIGFQEQEENTNEKTTNELGRSKRSTHAVGKIGKNTLGALLVRDLVSGVPFSVGSGMNDAVRLEIWQNVDKYLGKIVKYKSFLIGVKDLPRHPVFLGFRDVRDM